jgi:hypothetical protein
VFAIPAATAQAMRTGGHVKPLSWSGYTWRVHSGTNGSGQCQSPSHVSIVNGHLIETISKGCGGGVSMTLNKHQGTWSVTYRMTVGAGKYAILLWPKSGSRPEVDFAEDRLGDTARKLTSGTYHPLPGCKQCIQVKIAGDFTKYHTASVVWTSKGFNLLLDGNQWAHFPGGGYSGQMHLAIQAAPWGSKGSSTLEVSKVSVR